jgi:RNA polymerase sigma factor FliA
MEQTAVRGGHLQFGGHAMDGSRVAGGGCPALDRLWAAYKIDGDLAAREQLILHYAPLVKYLASRCAAGLPSSVDGSDLVSYGIIGLIDAIERFEPGRGNRFETYASRRVRGAILDELRSLDWAPRRIRARARALRRVESRLQSELRRAPSLAELATELGMTPTQVELLRTQIEVARVRSINEPVNLDGDEHPDVFTLADALVDPVDSIERIDVTESLVRAISELSDRHRQVIALSFDQQLTLREIGELLGITESRACQIRTDAINKVRDQLRAAERGRSKLQRVSVNRGDAA